MKYERCANDKAHQNLRVMYGLGAGEAAQEPVGPGGEDQRCGSQGKQVQARQDNDRKSKGFNQRHCLIRRQETTVLANAATRVIGKKGTGGFTNPASVCRAAGVLRAC